MTLDSSGGPNRRAFFHEALARAVGPLGDYLERHLNKRTDRHVLRPPGAISEHSFADTCKRCGACVEVCPAKAIVPLDESHGDAAGTPWIDADQAACVVCDGLKCTHVCPSGALLSIGEPTLIRMGLAEVYRPLCSRTAGDDCTLCVDMCPLGENAIRFVDPGPPIVDAEGCVGCGICQLFCPVTPKAIVSKPYSEYRESVAGSSQ